MLRERDQIAGDCLALQARVQLSDKIRAEKESAVQELTRVNANLNEFLARKFETTQEVQEDDSVAAALRTQIITLKTELESKESEMQAIESTWQKKLQK